MEEKLVLCFWSFLTIPYRPKVKKRSCVLTSSKYMDLKGQLNARTKCLKKKIGEENKIMFRNKQKSASFLPASSFLSMKGNPICALKLQVLRYAGMLVTSCQ